MARAKREVSALRSGFADQRDAQAGVIHQPEFAGVAVRV